VKIVVQSGHVLNRQDLEEFLIRVPTEWTQSVDFILVREVSSDSIDVTFHPKERSITVDCPKGFDGTTVDALGELAITLIALSDFGYLPKKLSKSMRSEYRSQWATINESE